MAGEGKQSRNPSGKLTTVEPMGFTAVVDAIRGVHEQCAVQAGKAVNVSLTLRNWLIGSYIHDYELHGTDRAKYGERLLENLADKLGAANVSNCNRRQLYRYLRFYRLYPEIVRALPPQFAALQPLTGAHQKVGTPSPPFDRDAHEILGRLSYSHLELLVDLDDDQQRAFYEIECMRGNWSVRELKRQIGALYFERSGLSQNPRKLAALVQAGTEAAEPKLSIRDPYVFEFLGQLNTYVSWFKHHMMTEGDNPPIGLLLCTHKDRALVEYALADLPNRLFVSKYQVELPSREQIQAFLEAQIKEEQS